MRAVLVSCFLNEYLCSSGTHLCDSACACEQRHTLTHSRYLRTHICLFFLKPSLTWAQGRRRTHLSGCKPAPSSALPSCPALSLETFSSVFHISVKRRRQWERSEWERGCRREKVKQEEPGLRPTVRKTSRDFFPPTFQHFPRRQSLWAAAVKCRGPFWWRRPTFLQVNGTGAKCPTMNEETFTSQVRARVKEWVIHTLSRRNTHLNRHKMKENTWI